MSNDDIIYLRGRVDAIHEMLVESKTKGEVLEGRVDKIEIDLKPIKAHVAFMGATVKLGSASAAVALFLHKMGLF